MQTQTATLALGYFVVLRFRAHLLKLVNGDETNLIVSG